MLRRCLLAAALVVAACGPDEPPPPPPIDRCLVTDMPTAVSLQIEVDDVAIDGVLSVTATCAVSQIVRNDAITHLNFDECEGTTTSATIAIGSVPSLRVDVDESDVLAIRYERTRPDLERHRFVMRRVGGGIAAALHTGSAIEADDFYAPLSFESLATECEPLPQMCFDGEKRSIAVTGYGAMIVAPTRHAVDDGAVHVRVEQADRLVNQMGCSLPPAWYDFLVTVDR